MPLGRSGPVTYGKMLDGLNPYCIGYASWANIIRTVRKRKGSLNPYCIGYASWAVETFLQDFKEIVLILIVLDMPLGPKWPVYQTKKQCLNPYCIG